MRTRASELATIRLIILLLLAIGSTYVVFVLLAPFLPAIVTSGVLAVLAHPLYVHVLGFVRRPSLAALLTTILIFFLVLLPIVGFSILLAERIIAGVAWIIANAGEVTSAASAPLQWLTGLAQRLGIDVDRAIQSLGEQAGSFGGMVATRTLAVATGIGGMALQAGAALFALYYFLRDGDRFVRALIWMIPLEPEDSARLVRRAREVTYATIYGNVVVAVVQGIIGGLAFWALGVPGALVWGTVMGVLSLLPVVGPSIIWLPAAVLLIASGSVVRGLVLFGVGALIVSTVDNLLRAAVMSGRAQLHPLVVFFSVLGGIFVFGGIGLFIGPVLFVLALAVVEMGRLALEPQADVARGSLILPASEPLEPANPPAAP